MIQEDYVSFEVAKLLKEKGFDEKCRSYYFGSSGRYSRCALEIKTNDFRDGEILRPTHQMACKWLREVHHYIIEIHYGNVGSPIEPEPEIQWWWELENKQGEFLEGNITDGNTTYEEACEAACLYVLKNLI